MIKRILAPVKYRRGRGGNMIRRFLLSAAFGLALCASAHAQDYPARPIRIVVPYPAGGSADLLPRIFAEKLGAKWGQAVLVENRPGAGGNIGAEFVYKADPDGYTLFATAPGPLVVNQNLCGKLRALAVCSEKRVASLPDVPAMSEILPGFSSVAWFGIVAPPKTPAQIAEKLSAAVAAAIRQPDVAKRLAVMSAEPIGGTPAEMAALMRRDGERWKSVIELARVKAD